MTDTKIKYGEIKDCPKCNRPRIGFNTQYYSGIEICDNKIVSIRTVSEPGKECLVITCSNCGYKWMELCADTED